MELGVRLGRVEARVEAAVDEIRAEREVSRRSHAEVSNRLTGIEETLHGNGRPGIMERLAVGDTMLRELSELRSRVKYLEMRLYMAMGAFAIALWLLERFF